MEGKAIMSFELPTEIQQLVAEYPFNDPDADVILRSSDNIDFRVHKYLLSLRSPFFKDMFSLPQSPDVPGGGDSAEWKDGLPIIRMSEEGSMLKRMLKLFDSRCGPSFTTLDDIQASLEVASKYEVAGLTEHARIMLVKPEFLKDDPLRIFAIACRYKFPGELSLAALHTLQVSLMEGNYSKDMEYITAGTLFRLLQYRQACVNAALCVGVHQIADNFGWTKCGACIPDKTPKKVWSPPGTVENGRTWWMADYMAEARSSLKDRPWSTSILDKSEWIDRASDKALACSRCKISFCERMRGFIKAYAESIDREVMKVDLNINL